MYSLVYTKHNRNIYNGKKEKKIEFTDKKKSKTAERDFAMTSNKCVMT